MDFMLFSLWWHGDKILTIGNVCDWNLFMVAWMTYDDRHELHLEILGLFSVWLFPKKLKA